MELPHPNRPTATEVLEVRLRKWNPHRTSTHIHAAACLLAEDLQQAGFRIRRIPASPTAPADSDDTPPRPATATAAPPNGRAAAG